jgi:hypothetical protein
MLSTQTTRRFGMKVFGREEQNKLREKSSVFIGRLWNLSGNNRTGPFHYLWGFTLTLECDRWTVPRRVDTSSDKGDYKQIC